MRVGRLSLVNYAKEFTFYSKHNAKPWEDIYFIKITMAAE